jgi:UDP-N-acetylmuramate dehydrogenase
MDLSKVAAEVAERSQARVEQDYSLARYTTYRLGGKAALYLEPRSARDLEVLGEALRHAPERDRPPMLILGRGSNLVISDHGFDGIVVRMGAAFSWLRPAGDRDLVAGASTPLPQVANWAARRSLSGMEFGVSIPGSVGGAVHMNAGAHGGEIADVLTGVTIFKLQSLEVASPAVSTLGFAYRRSNLTGDDLVLDATFSLRPDEPQQIRGRMENFREHRAATQPGAAQNAGSVFKNPSEGSAGRLVEEAGLKGFRVGGASVSQLHANFMIAGSGATAQDVYDLVRIVRRKVQSATGVDLEPEIRFVGPFEDRPLEAHR